MKLYYNKLGSGPPLFILHGLFGMSDNFLTVGKKLAKSFTVYLVDLRNFGQSPHSDEWTYPAMAEDVKELMDDVLGLMANGTSTSTINHQPLAILMGHSMGGKVAMQFAAKYPEKLEKLIVVDMAPKDYYPSNSFDFIQKLLSINLAGMKSRKEAEAELRKIIRDEATIQLLLKNIHWNEKEQLDWKFNLKVIEKNHYLIKESFSIGEKAINVPTLFIRGERSNYILDSDTPKIKGHFPNSEIKTIEGAGHWVHAEKPEKFLECVEEFLK